MSTTIANTNGNGQGKAILWIVGALFVPIILTVFGHLYRTTYDNALEISALRAETHDIKVNLHRIDNKLDRLLEHNHR